MTKEAYDKLVDVTTEILKKAASGNEKGAYQLFFALSAEDRRLVEETMKKGMRTYPVPWLRKAAKRMAKLIKQNFEKEVGMMIDTWKKLLEDWFDKGKEVFYVHFQALSEAEQEMMMMALKEVIAKSDNAEFQQAAKDIPEYIVLQTKTNL